MLFITSMSVNSLHSVIINSTISTVFHKVSDTFSFLSMLNILEINSLEDLSGCQCCEYKVKEEEHVQFHVFRVWKESLENMLPSIFFDHENLHQSQSMEIPRDKGSPSSPVSFYGFDYYHIFLFFLQYVYTYTHNCLLALCPEQNNYQIMLQSFISN